MRTADFDYELPPDLIAARPAARRDEARMLVLNRITGAVAHARFAELPERLRPRDLLVVNDTKVLPVRLRAFRPTGGALELFLVEPERPGCWLALYRSRKPLAPGTRLILDGDAGEVTVGERAEGGLVRVVFPPGVEVEALLERVGHVPLPPYILRARGEAADDADDRQRYQTVFAREPGAVAAPTAGLHFTPEILDRLAARGVARATITLHVGPGTFRPVKAERPEDHVMDAERFRVPPETAAAVAAARAAGGRLVAVGSTCVRALETVARDHDGRIAAAAGRSDLFIRPPYAFRAVEALLTNFHLPRSTLLMMVCAFAGAEPVLAAYREAVRARYRFYSYGDCMLIG